MSVGPLTSTHAESGTAANSSATVTDVVAGVEVAGSGTAGSHAAAQNVSSDDSTYAQGCFLRQRTAFPQRGHPWVSEGVTHAAGHLCYLSSRLLNEDIGEPLLRHERMVTFCEHD